MGVISSSCSYNERKSAPLGYVLGYWSCFYLTEISICPRTESVYLSFSEKPCSYYPCSHLGATMNWIVSSGGLKPVKEIWVTQGNCKTRREIWGTRLYGNSCIVEWSSIILVRFLKDTLMHHCADLHRGSLCDRVTTVHCLTWDYTAVHR